ncbi:MAG TPA: pyridoxal phosphate-dependent aminotransferase [Candidatus Polarisedimenticolia bacterium]|nr:pyridoxal phosphate-dependent aminotransferase [Candidatus Polarisedimenticolia bacterium]
MFASRTNWNLKTNRLAQALERHKSSGRRLLDLSASNPTECGFTYDTPAIMRALCSPASLQYHPDPKGLKSARQAVSDYYAEHGERVAIDDLLLTASTSEAYSFIFRLLCNPGDELLIPTPGYPLFDFLADANDVKLIRYPLFYDHGWHIDMHALEQAITPQTRGVIVVHPNNPTGHFTRPEETAQLNQICSARQMAIIADEVFLDFSLGATQKSFVANAGALTFTMSGISKISGLPQMKFAWLAVSGPEDIKREALARLEMIADTYLSLNAPIQLAAPVLLRQRVPFQQQLTDRVRRNLAELDSQLAGNQHVSRLAVEGGWYAVLRIPSTRTDEDLAIELLDKHDVYLHPGHFYDFPSDGYLVVSLITPEQDFSEGSRQILSALR